MTLGKLDKRDVACVSVLLIVFAVTVLIVDPRGDFPLNDDWSFALTARKLAFQHIWQPTGWASMSLITQSLWAAPACALLGCSFQVLRGTTIAAALLLLVSSYCLFRTVGPSRLLAAVGVCLTVFNPVVYALTYTFMTDVLFEALLVVSAVFYVRSLQRGAAMDIALATGGTIVATLCRQLGLCLPIAFCAAYWLVSTEKVSRRSIKAAAPFVISVLVLIAYESWLRGSGRAPALYDQKTDQLFSEFRSPLHGLLKTGYHTAVSLMYLGLFCLPLSVLTIGSWPRERRFLIRSPLVLGCIASVVGVAGLVAKGKLMPLGGNVLSAQGIGPNLLRDEFFLGLHNAPRLPWAFWVAVTLASGVGAWLLLYQAVALVLRVRPFLISGKMPAGLGIGLFGLVAVVANLMPLMIATLLDRYPAVLVPIISLVSLAVADPCRSKPVPRMRQFGAWACSVMIVAFSVLATHDYMSLNRARWRAIGDLETSGEANAKTLDGGFEYNGYRSYDPGYLPNPLKSWWWVDDDTYQLAFGPVPHMDIVKRYQYPAYLSQAPRFIYVLKHS